MLDSFGAGFARGMQLGQNIINAYRMGANQRLLASDMAKVGQTTEDPASFSKAMGLGNDSGPGSQAAMLAQQDASLGSGAAAADQATAAALNSVPGAPRADASKVIPKTYTALDAYNDYITQAAAKGIMSPEQMMQARRLVDADKLDKIKLVQANQDIQTGALNQKLLGNKVQVADAQLPAIKLKAKDAAVQGKTLLTIDQAIQDLQQPNANVGQIMSQFTGAINDLPIHTYAGVSPDGTHFAVVSPGQNGALPVPMARQSALMALGWMRSSVADPTSFVKMTLTQEQIKNDKDYRNAEIGIQNKQVGIAAENAAAKTKLSGAEANYFNAGGAHGYVKPATTTPTDLINARKYLETSDPQFATDSAIVQNQKVNAFLLSLNKPPIGGATPASDAAAIRGGGPPAAPRPGAPAGPPPPPLGGMAYNSGRPAVPLPPGLAIPSGPVPTPPPGYSGGAFAPSVTTAAMQQGSPMAGSVPGLMPALTPPQLAALQAQRLAPPTDPAMPYAVGPGGMMLPNANISFLPASQ